MFKYLFTKIDFLFILDIKNIFDIIELHKYNICKNDKKKNK